MNSSALRTRLVAELEAQGRLSSERVRRAFLAVPREAFVPEFAAAEGVEAVYRDDAIITRRDSHGAATSSSSQPTIMALMLERLDLHEGQRVLEIGTGTGYNAALLSRIVGPSGRVVSVELDPDLARSARTALRKGSYKAWVVTGDGRLGWEQQAPYDRIIVTASAEEVPRSWFEQLAPDALVEVPLRLTPEGSQAIPVLRKEGDGLRSISVTPGGFMPLRGQADETTVAQHPLTLVVNEVDGSQSRQLLHLSGRGLAALSEAARRRLLALALSRPRVRRVALHGDEAWSLYLYLSLELPGRAIVSSWAPTIANIGLVGSAGRSMALFTAPLDDRASHLRFYGSREAEERLVSLVERWKAAGRMDPNALRIAMDFHRGQEELRWSWSHRRA